MLRARKETRSTLSVARWTAGVLLIRADRVIIRALFAAEVAGLALAYPLTPMRARC
jgi:hypothetical protein